MYYCRKVLKPQPQVRYRPRYAPRFHAEARWPYEHVERTKSQVATNRRYVKHMSTTYFESLIRSARIASERRRENGGHTEDDNEPAAGGSAPSDSSASAPPSLLEQDRANIDSVQQDILGYLEVDNEGFLFVFYFFEPTIQSCRALVVDRR